MQMIIVNTFIKKTNERKKNIDAVKTRNIIVVAKALVE